MAEVKYEFEGIAKFNAMLVFTALASGPYAYLTTGILGKFVFFVLKKIGNWIANQGLALANIGIEEIRNPILLDNYDSTMNDALNEVLRRKGRLTDEEKKAIDDKVKDAARNFIRFV